MTYRDEITEDLWAGAARSGMQAERAALEPEPGGLPVVPSGVTRRGSAYVVLTLEQVSATADSGLVRTEGGELVTWYGLGKAFDRDGVRSCYAYLRFDREVSRERQSRRDAAAWRATFGGAR